MLGVVVDEGCCLGSRAAHAGICRWTRKTRIFAIEMEKGDNVKLTKDAEG